VLNAASGSNVQSLDCKARGGYRVLLHPAGKDHILISAPPTAPESLHTLGVHLPKLLISGCILSTPDFIDELPEVHPVQDANNACNIGFTFRLPAAATDAIDCNSTVGFNLHVLPDKAE
jgi:hypothetical protein